MLKVKTDIVLYDNKNELEFPTDHPYWLSVDGYFIKLSKTSYSELFDVLNPKPKMTEEEKMILKAINQEFTWIARDPDGELWLFKEEPQFSRTLNYFTSLSKKCVEFAPFNDLFSSIQSGKKYKIACLITATSK